MEDISFDLVSCYSAFSSMELISIGKIQREGLSGNISFE